MSEPLLALRYQAGGVESSGLPAFRQPLKTLVTSATLLTPSIHGRSTSTQAGRTWYQDTDR
ncbi:hypothetical protein M3J07_007474 [Ascochyta lentis]